MSWNAIKRWRRGRIEPGAGDAVKHVPSRTMAVGIMTTRPDEISCAEFFQQVGVYVEVALAGGHPAAAMPLVRDHLDRCPDCREEYEVLLAALQFLA